MAHSPSTPESSRGTQGRDARRTDSDARYLLSQPQECLSTQRGHQTVPVADRIGSTLQPGREAAAWVDEQGYVWVCVDGVSAPYWNHRPDRVAAALAITDAQITFDPERILLLVELTDGRRVFFSLATLHAPRTCVHIPAREWHRAGREVAVPAAAHTTDATAPHRSGSGPRSGGEQARDRRAGLPYRVSMRHPGQSAALHESAHPAPLMSRLEARSKFAPATDARLWSPRGRLLAERVNYWVSGRLVDSDRWFELFPPRTGIVRTLDELSRYRPMREGQVMAEFRIAVGGYDGRVLGRLSPDEVAALRSAGEREQSALPGLETSRYPVVDFFAPDIW